MAIDLEGHILDVSMWPDRDLANVSRGDLHYHYFAGDITFRVDGADFSTQNWGWVTVLDFAVALRTVVAALEPGGAEEFEFTENDDRIRFRRTGDVVQVSATYVTDTASVDHTALLQAAEAFLDGLATRLIDAHPRLMLNPAFLQMVGRGPG